MIFPLFKSWLRPLLGSALGSSHKTYKTPSGLRTIGGGGGPNARGRRRRGLPSVNPITTTLTFGESEERMVKEAKLHALDDFAPASPAPAPAPAGCIMVSKQVRVTTEDRGSQSPQRDSRHIGEW